MRIFAQLLCCLVASVAVPVSALGKDVHHYVFFNLDQERIADAAFLGAKGIEGAQLKYTWRELEPQKDDYEFGAIEHDLSFLQSKGKKLFIQVQDVSFDTNHVPIPRYLLTDSQFHGGTDLQFNIENDNEGRATPEGWVARRWDPAVRERFQRLLTVLGHQFDGRIEGINLPETAVDFGETGKLFPKGFTPDLYCEAIMSNMTALKRAFPKSVAMQYANFMPGEEKYLKIVYQKAVDLKVGMGGPDLLPYKPWQMRNSYPLIREYSSAIPTGIAVQEGNYELRNPKTGRQVTVSELVDFATGYLGVDYIFWCTQEPYYSKTVMPLLQSLR